MGVPFGQHPLGFMVIRNMKQYTDRPEPQQLACFVAMMMLEQIRRTRMEKLTKMHNEDDGRFRIRYNILGPHNFMIDGKEIYEQDLPHPNRRAWIIIAADETGNSTAREKFLQKAAEDLIDEENEKLMKLLALQNHLS